MIENPKFILFSRGDMFTVSHTILRKWHSHIVNQEQQALFQMPYLDFNYMYIQTCLWYLGMLLLWFQNFCNRYDEPWASILASYFLDMHKEWMLTYIRNVSTCSYIDMICCTYSAVPFITRPMLSEIIGIDACTYMYVFLLILILDKYMCISVNILMRYAYVCFMYIYLF